MALPALPSLLMRRVLNGAPLFFTYWDSLFSDDFFHSHPLRFASLTSLHESGRFDAPLTMNSLWRFPSATSLRQVRTASHTHSSEFHSRGGVIFNFPFSPWSCASLWVPSTWKSSLVVPVIKRAGDPASLDSCRPMSLASCAFIVSENLVCARIAPHILPQLDPSQGGFRWGADAMAFSLVDTLRLLHHQLTFVLFIDIKKAFDSCWVEATLVRLDFGVTGSFWHLLANFLCGTLFKVRLGDSVSSPWVDSGIAQGRSLSPLLFNLLSDRLAVTLRSAIPSVSLAASDSFRHVCQSMLMTSSF